MITLLLGAALTGTAVTQASASPTTQQRRQVAEQVATSVCRTVPVIPKLPATVNVKKVCQSVIVEDVDPDGNNIGIRAACEQAIPAFALPAVRFCTAAMDKLLDPARKLFLDRVVPAAQKLACITSAPATFDCLAQQVHVWLQQSVVGLWQGLLTVLTSKTQVIGLLDGWRNHGIVSVYSDVGSVGAMLLLGVVLISLIISVIRMDFRRLGGTIFGVITWGLFWSGGAAIAVLLMKASDEISKWLAGRPDASGTTDLDRAGRQFLTWVEYVSNAAPTTTVGIRPNYEVGSFAAILICVLLIIAIVATLVALLMRNIALLMIIVALPLTLAGAAGPRLTREWFHAALRMFIAMLLAKPLIVIAVRVGSVMVSVPSKGQAQASFSDALLGVAIILLAALLPGVIYRFSGGLMSSSAAGAAPHASGGVSAQASQSMVSSGDMLRMIMDRNAPTPVLAGSSGSRAALGRTGPVSAGGAAQTRAAGAAGPIGVAAMGAVLAISAAESGGRWLAGHAATGGGVFGDVEAPHVPGPPVSRLPYRNGQTSTGGGDQQGEQQSASKSGSNTREPSSSKVTIVQQTPPETHRPAIDGGADVSPDSHLIIPGTVLPDAEPPEGPHALPPAPADDDHGPNDHGADDHE
ncbi:hypothetical protein [Microlunatus endophyticus]